MSWLSYAAANAEPAVKSAVAPRHGDCCFPAAAYGAWYLSYGVAAYTSYVFFTWFYLYLVNVRGMTKTAGGYWAGLPYVAVTIGTLAGGRLSDWLTLRYGKRIGRLSVVLAGEGLAALLIVLGGQN